MEFLFRKDQPVNTVLKTGRQVSKTTTVIIQHILQCATIDYFTALCVTPLESQALRLSSLFIRPILDESLIPRILPLISRQALTYTLRNNSSIILSYAHDDPERTRGVPGDKLHVDEAQDMNIKFIPIIHAALSASKYQWSIYTGTPKTHNNTLQYLWLQSSQDEWATKCTHCGHWNIASLEHDLEKMIGPYRDDISLENPATICAKCQKIINPADGGWVSAIPDRFDHFVGLHIPQVIIPRIYGDKLGWSQLLAKQKGMYSTTPADFCREVLGEASDVSAKLLTLKELQDVATLGRKDEIERIKNSLRAYDFTTFGIDWGGGGAEGNFTTIALVCHHPSGMIEVPWAIELTTPHDHIREAKEILYWYNIFKPTVVAHDYTGAGSLRETLLIHAGIPFNRIMPMRYVAQNKGVTCRYVPGTDQHPKPCWHIDPNRGMQLVCATIKFKQIRMFADDFDPNTNTGLLRQFLSLAEEYADEFVSKVYQIVCEPGYRDEFPQCVMLGCIAIWQRLNRWPRFEL